MRTLGHFGRGGSAALLLLLAGCTSSVAIEDVPEQQSDTLCALVGDCVPEDLASVFGLGRVNCETYVTGQYEAGLDSVQVLIDRGTILYDGAAAARCFSDMRALGCELTISAEPESCRDIFVGTVEIGGACSIDDECAGEAYCLSALCPAEAGTCTARQASGTACTGDEQCESGLVCEDDVCRVPTNTSGGPCGGDSDLDCPLDQYCLGEDATTRGTCTPWASVLTIAAGQPCDPTMEDFCQEGLSCVVTAVDPTTFMPTWECRARVGAGAACGDGFPGQCPDTHFCTANPLAGTFEGTCDALPVAGEGCHQDENEPACAPGLTCNVSLNCVVPVDNGGTCSDNSDCFSRRCVSGTCEPAEVCPEA